MNTIATETPIQLKAGERTLANTMFYVGNDVGSDYFGSFDWSNGTFSYLYVGIQNNSTPITTGSCVVRVGIEINNQTTYQRYTLSKEALYQSIKYTEGITSIHVVIESTQDLPQYTLLQSCITQQF